MAGIFSDQTRWLRRTTSEQKGFPISLWLSDQGNLPIEAQSMLIFLANHQMQSIFMPCLPPQASGATIRPTNGPILRGGHPRRHGFDPIKASSGQVRQSQSFAKPSVTVFAAKQPKAVIDEMTLACLRINCVLGHSTKILFGLYALMPPNEATEHQDEASSPAQTLMRALRDLDAQLYKKSISTETEQKIDSIIAYCAREQISLLHPYSENYPQSLQEIPDRPLLLYARGKLDNLNATQIAIVGSRRSTPPAQGMAKRLATELSQAGIVVTSGLARGCDLAAHQGACTVVAGQKTIDFIPARTVAVLGHGIDLIYPKQHKNIADKIVNNGGCLISEFNPGTAPLAHNFPRRNRIIAGMTVATIVVEAGLKSGSLISARLANEYNREVFAVPGSPACPTAHGCHKLIKDGAHLLESSADLADVLGHRWPVFNQFAARDEDFTRPQPGANPGGKVNLSQVLRGYLNHIGAEGLGVDEFAQACNINIFQAQTVLLDFEIQGLVRQTLTGKFFRIV